MPWTVAVVETAQEEDTLVVVLEATDGERRVQARVSTRTPEPGWVAAQARRLILRLEAQDAVRAEIAPGEPIDTTPPPPPPPSRRVPLRDFLMLFTAQERIWLRARQAQSDAHGQALLDWYDLLRLTDSIDLDSPTLDRALSYLISLGGLTADRKAAILSGTPPA